MINNPSEDVSYENTQISRAIWAALQTQNSNLAKNFITKMAKEETAEALGKGADIKEFSVGVSLLDLRFDCCYSSFPRVDEFCSGFLILFLGLRRLFSESGRLQEITILATFPLLLFNLENFNVYVITVISLKHTSV